MNSNNPDILTEWNYSDKEWNCYVKIEKENKKEDNVFFGLGIVIVGIFALMMFRDTSFLTALAFTVPFAILIPFLRMKISYPFLKNTDKNASVTIFKNKLLINRKEIITISDHRRLKLIQIIDSKKLQLLEFTVEWGTRKGPTNDEFRVLIPHNKMEEAQAIIAYFNDNKDGKREITFGDVLKTIMR
jgi:hypothetical protein